MAAIDEQPASIFLHDGIETLPVFRVPRFVQNLNIADHISRHAGLLPIRSRGGERYVREDEVRRTHKRPASPSRGAGRLSDKEPEGEIAELTLLDFVRNLVEVARDPANTFVDALDVVVNHFNAEFEVLFAFRRFGSIIHCLGIAFRLFRHCACSPTVTRRATAVSFSDSDPIVGTSG
jgi:hypothetical protein